MNFTYPEKLQNWIDQNDKWVRATMEDKQNMKPTSLEEQDDKDYWYQVSLVIQQFDGLFAGYNRLAPQGQVIL
jgi:hypothetical protein